MRPISFLCCLVITALVLPAAARADDVPPGSYVTAGGWGRLTIAPAENNKMPFTLLVVGGNAHTCDLKGSVDPETWIATSAADGAEPCNMTFHETQGSVKVDVKTKEACRNYCGARAWVEGVYLPLAEQCDVRKAQDAIEAFGAVLPADEAAFVEKNVMPILNGCQQTLTEPVRLGLRQTVALAAFHAGDKVGCRSALSQEQNFMNKGVHDIAAEFAGEPVNQDQYIRLSKSLRDTSALCQEETK